MNPKKYLTLCLLGGMFGLHEFYAKQNASGFAILFMTLAGIGAWMYDRTVWIITMPAVICLYTAYKTYTQDASNHPNP